MKRIYIFLAIAALAASCTGRTAPATDAGYPADATVYELNVRQMTPEGTFAAAGDRLASLKDLGVDIVWVMPPYPIGEQGRKGSLGSYYAVRDYCDINPEFGSLADFDAFLDKAHSLGLKVILDWVANHTAPDHPWATEQDPDWYVRDKDGNTIVEHDWTDIAKLNYDNLQMRQEMEKSMRFWVDRGVDGFRCDVAYKVPEDFWKPVIRRLRESTPRELYFLAEGEESWLHAAGFDATYAWKLHHLLNSIARGKADADSLTAYIDWNAANYPSDALRLSFTSNHDENSWSGTEFERMGDAWQAMAVLCWTLPSSQPLIYTGQEIGYDHRFAFFEKDPIPEWKTNSYTEFYRYLNSIRHSHPALDAGAGEYRLLSTEGNTIVFSRTLGDDSVKVSVQLEAPWEWSISSESDRVAHIEPPCWWTGMRTPLQIMINGEDISSYDIAIENGNGVSIKEIHKAESPNYVFVDMDIPEDAAPGTRWFIFSRGSDSFRIPYEISGRREGSALRRGFSTADAVYLIMPDRFVNSDKTNDNSASMTEKADYKAFFGRHGGDIQGIMDQLDYISGLGMTSIWCTPLLEDNEPSGSYHGYACTDYYKIDPRFGSNFKYRELVREARAKGLGMIMDIVTNHCGDAHWWMSDLPFSDWVHRWPEYTHSNCAFSVHNDPYCSQHDRDNMVGGWFDTSMVDMNLDNPYLLQYFKQWAIWWTEWADLGGLRVDTYPYNEKEPMSEWCKAVMQEYPDYNIVGEVWSSNVPQVAYWQADNPNRDGFNSHLPSIMDFCLMDAVRSGINTDKEDWDNGFTRIYDSMANDFYFTAPDKMMVFPGNHDTDRIGDVVRKDPAKMKLVMSLMATVRGFPQIFAGDEMMAVSDDLSQGHGGLRVMFPLNWESDPVSKDLHDYVSTLFQWRKGSEAVHNGKTLHFLSRDNTYAFFRYTDDEAVFVYLNNNSTPRTVPWADYAEITSSLKGKGHNIFDGSEFNAESCLVPAKSSIIIEFK